MAQTIRPVLLDPKTMQPVGPASFPAESVALADGSTLADWEPSHLLCTLTHSFDGFPLPLLVGERGGVGVMLPVGVRYPCRWEVEVFTCSAWAGALQVIQRTDRMYDALLNDGVVHIRLI